MLVPSQFGEDYFFAPVSAVPSADAAVGCAAGAFTASGAVAASR